MRNALSIAGLLAFLIAAFVMPGCDRPTYPTQTGQPQESMKEFKAGTITTAVLPQSVVLEGFTVTYNGRSLANNQTTFSYTVSGPNGDFHYRLELPPCAPALASESPANGATSNNDAFINPGIEWHPSTGSSSTSTNTFSVTYPGTVREGIVLTSVNTPSGTAAGLIAG